MQTTATHDATRSLNTVCLALALGLAAFSIGCGVQVPAHEVDVWSDCSGEPRRGRYAFDDHNFETTGCGGSRPSMSSCNTSIDEGRALFGDDVVDRIYITGTEHSELYQYVLLIEPQPGQIISSPGGYNTQIMCSFYRDDETGEHTSLGQKVNCLFSNNSCQARIDIVGE